MGSFWRMIRAVQASSTLNLAIFYIDVWQAATIRCLSQCLFLITSPAGWYLLRCRSHVFKICALLLKDYSTRLLKSGHLTLPVNYLVLWEIVVYTKSHYIRNTVSEDRLERG